MIVSTDTSYHDISASYEFYFRVTTTNDLTYYYPPSPLLPLIFNIGCGIVLTTSSANDLVKLTTNPITIQSPIFYVDVEETTGFPILPLISDKIPNCGICERIIVDYDPNSLPGDLVISSSLFD